MGVGDIDVNATPGFTRGLISGNEISKGSIQNRIKSIEAEYAPYTNYANAASKIAYSQFVGPQAISSILNNPAMRGMFTPEQYNSLASAFTQQVKNPAMTLANLPVPSQQRNPLRHLVESLGNLFSSPQSPNQGNMHQQGMQNNSQMFTSQNNAQNIPSQNSGQEYGDINRASPELVKDISLHGNNAPQLAPASQGKLGGTSPTYQRESKGLPSGTYGAQSPGSVINAGEEALKAQTKAEAQAISDQWKQRQDDIRNEAINATASLDNVKRMKSAYSKLDPILETGPFIGRLPAVSAAAQDLDLAANDLMISKIKAWQSGRVTNMDVQFGPSLKPGRYMNEKEFNHASSYEQASQQRHQEYPSFSNGAQAAGLSPTQADTVWVRYINERPVYDNKNQKILGKNLDSWEEFLKPDQIKQTFSPSYRKQMEQYQNNMYGADEEKDNQIEKSLDQKLNSDGPGVRMLEKQLELPKFSSKEDFQKWFAKQPSIVQKAVRKRLGNK